MAEVEPSSTLVLICTAVGALLSPFAADFIAKRRRKEETTEGEKVEAKVVSATVADADAVRALTEALHELKIPIDRLLLALDGVARSSTMDARQTEESNRELAACVRELIKVARTMTTAEMRKMTPDMQDLLGKID